MKVNIILNNKDKQDLKQYKNENIILRRKLKKVRSLLVACVDLLDFESDSSSENIENKRTNRKRSYKSKNIGEIKSKNEKSRKPLISNQSTTKLQRIASIRERQKNHSTDISPINGTASNTIASIQSANSSTFLSSSPYSGNNEEVEMYETANDSNIPKGTVQQPNYADANGIIVEDFDEEMDYVRASGADRRLLNQSNFSIPRFGNRTFEVSTPLIPQLFNSYRVNSSCFPNIGPFSTPHPCNECKFFVIIQRLKYLMHVLRFLQIVQV